LRKQRRKKKKPSIGIGVAALKQMGGGGGITNIKKKNQTLRETIKGGNIIFIARRSQGKFQISRNL